jgi:hypothetical protein
MVDRVELRSSGGVDAWRPTCVEMQWDGEPVHRSDGLTTPFGNGGGSEVERWSDPAGVHVGCRSCYPEPITHGPMVGETTPTTARVFVRTDASRRVSLRLADEARPGELRSAGVRYPLPDGVIEAARPDLFLFVGDNHYANSPDLESLWWYYRRALEVPERASLLARVPTLAVWDDHDFVGNNTNRTSPGRESALRAFGDYWAVLPTGLPAEPGVYFRASWGDIDLFMLDDRYERDVPGGAGA